MAAVGGLMAEAKRYKEPRPKQIERLMAVLADGGAYSHLTSLATPVHLPHQPSIEIAGVVPDHSTILKSALNPVKLTVRTTGGVTRAVLFKQSNDLRRDQLILSRVVAASAAQVAVQVAEPVEEPAVSEDVYIVSAKKIHGCIYGYC